MENLSIKKRREEAEIWNLVPYVFTNIRYILCKSKIKIVIELVDKIQCNTAVVFNSSLW